MEEGTYTISASGNETIAQTIANVSISQNYFPLLLLIFYISFKALSDICPVGSTYKTCNNGVLMLYVGKKFL